MSLVELVRGYSNTPPLPDFERSTKVRQPRHPSPRRHAAPARLGSTVVAQLVADYQAGQPTTALMKTYGLGKGSVLRLLRANGVQLRHQSMADDEVQQVIQLYGQGLSLARVGERFDRDASYIALVLERAGVPRRDPQGRVR